MDTTYPTHKPTRTKPIPMITCASCGKEFQPTTRSQAICDACNIRNTPIEELEQHVEDDAKKEVFNSLREGLHKIQEKSMTYYCKLPGQHIDSIIDVLKLTKENKVVEEKYEEYALPLLDYDEKYSLCNMWRNYKYKPASY